MGGGGEVEWTWYFARLAGRHPGHAMLTGTSSTDRQPSCLTAGPDLPACQAILACLDWATASPTPHTPCAPPPSPQV